MDFGYFINKNGEIYSQKDSSSFKEAKNKLEELSFGILGENDHAKGRVYKIVNGKRKLEVNYDISFEDGEINLEEKIK